MSKVRSPTSVKMVRLIEKLAPNEGYTQSTLESVRLMRSDRPLGRTPVLYEPSIVLVCQGRKLGFLGNEVYVYDALHYLVLSVPLPFSTETQASAEEPMLAVSIRLDLLELSDLITQIAALGQLPDEPPNGMVSTQLDENLAGTTVRLLEALTVPMDAHILGQSLVREICYRVTLAVTAAIRAIGDRAMCRRGFPMNKAGCTAAAKRLFTVTICLAVLSGCAAVHAVSDDYSAQFVGTYQVTERSTERLLPFDSVRLSSSAAGAALITFTMANKSGSVSASCHSTFGKWFRAVQVENEDQTFRGYDCMDESGRRWQFVRATPGSRTTMPVLNRLSRQDVTSQSGYLLFVSLMGIPGLHYALMPVTAHE